MTAYYIDWLNLLLRWLHLITGIAWIGSSFYFVWLDNSLEEPSADNKQKGFAGQLSSIHAGGFYEIGKYQVAPATMPENLHWFKWEAYSTWITGFFLFGLMYYLGANAYLLDSSKNTLTAMPAIGISLLTLIGGWFVYDGLCKSPVAKNGWLLAAVLLAGIGALACGLEKIFSDRAAYIHIGALIGTCMAGNVFRIIMPGQRAMVASIEKGETPDPKYALASKLRSVHNNYLTLPVIFIMVSNHYPMTYGHQYAWAVLIAIMLIGAWARHFFNLRHKGIIKPSILVSSAIALAVLAWVISPNMPKPNKAAASQEVVTIIKIADEQAYAIVQARCVTCHAEDNTDPLFTMAQGGVKLDSIEKMKQWAPRIQARAVITQDMPFMNKTGITEQERQTLGKWVEQQ